MPTPGLRKLPTLLIADGCPRTRALIRTTLSDLVGEIWEAEDGCDAVEICQDHNPDWVTLDIALQLLDGVTAMRMIKFANHETRVIIVTGHDSLAFREATGLHGAADYILKSEVWKIRTVIDPSAFVAPPVPSSDQLSAR